MDLTQTVAIVMVVSFCVVLICALALVAYAARESRIEVEHYIQGGKRSFPPLEHTSEHETFVRNP